MRKPGGLFVPTDGAGQLIGMLYAPADGQSIPAPAGAGAQAGDLAIVLAGVPSGTGWVSIGEGGTVAYVKLLSGAECAAPIGCNTANRRLSMAVFRYTSDLAFRTFTSYADNTGVTTPAVPFVKNINTAGLIAICRGNAIGAGNGNLGTPTVAVANRFSETTLFDASDVFNISEIYSVKYFLPPAKSYNNNDPFATNFGGGTGYVCRMSIFELLV